MTLEGLIRLYVNFIDTGDLGACGGCLAKTDVHQIHGGCWGRTELTAAA